MDLLKDLPIKAIPFVIFLAGCTTFGELFIRIPAITWLHEFMSGAMAICTLASALLFFTKVFLNWPPLRGIEYVK